MASSHCDFNQNIAGNPSWCLSRTTSIAIFYILLLKKRKAKEMSPHSKAEINVEGEETIAFSSQKGLIAINGSRGRPGAKSSTPDFYLQVFL